MPRWLIPVILVIIIVGVIAASLWYFFGDVSSAARLVPAESMMYIRLATGDDKKLNLPADNYLSELGDVFWQSFSLANPEFSYENDVAPWIGEEIVLTKASPDLLDPFVAIAQVGDKQKALEMVENLSGKVGSSGLSEERYKGITIYSVSDPLPMSACYIKGYAIISTSIESVKQVIDVGNQDSPSIAELDEFRDLEQELLTDDTAMLVALRLRESLQATTNTLGVNEQLFVKQLNIPPEVLLGVSISSADEGLNIKTYTNVPLFADSVPFEPHLESNIPAEAIAYYEGSNLVSIINDFVDDQVKINEDSLGWVNGSFAVAFLPQTGDNRSAIGLIIETDGTESAREQLESAEPIILAMLARFGVIGAVEFDSGEVEGVATRYANFTEGVRMDLNYAVLDDKIFFTTSPESLEMLVNAARGNLPALSESDTYAKVRDGLKSDAISGFAFVNADTLASFMSGEPIAESEEVPPGFVEQVLSPFASIGTNLLSTQDRHGVFVTESFLPFK